MAGPLFPVLVQTVTTNFASVSSISQAITVTNAGDTLVLTVVNRGVSSGYAATAVSGCGATWYRVGTGVRATSGAVDIWVGVNASSGSQTAAITINGTQTAGCNLDEWQYLDASALINDYALSASATGSTTSATITVTPDDLNELVYVASSSANTETVSPASPYSTLAGPTSSGAQVAGIGYWVTNTLTASAAAWTQTTGAWTVVAVVLRSQQPSGYRIWNVNGAQNNGAVLGQQSAPDYLDSVISGFSETGTGVLSGCAVGPNTASDFNWQNAAGTALFNWGSVAVAAGSAHAITTADATNPRKDLVYVDSAGTVHYLAGTANATPCLPSPPVTPFVALAEIDVPANAATFDNGTSTSNAHPTDKRAILGYPPSLRDHYLSPTGALAETIPWIIAGSTVATSVSGVIYWIPIALPAGLTIGHIAFASNAAASTPTHWWFGLSDSNQNLLAATADQTTTAWAASTLKSLAIATTAQGSQASFTTTYTGLYYLMWSQTASTTNSLKGGPADIVNSVGENVVPGTFQGRSGSVTAPPAFPFQGATPASPPTGIVYGYVTA